MVVAGVFFFFKGTPGRIFLKRFFEGTWVFFFGDRP